MEEKTNKTTAINETIHAAFKAKIANCIRDVAAYKARFAILKTKYMQMVSDDLKIMSDIGINDLVDSYCRSIESLRNATDQLKDINTAYDKWRFDAEISTKTI